MPMMKKLGDFIKLDKFSLVYCCNVTQVSTKLNTKTEHKYGKKAELSKHEYYIEAHSAHTNKVSKS